MYRLVTRQGNNEHVSSVILSDEEGPEHLSTELDLHVASGWQILQYIADLQFTALSRNGVLREVQLRKYDPMSPLD